MGIYNIQLGLRSETREEEEDGRETEEGRKREKAALSKRRARTRS